jgi:NAD(P)H-dependent FMN reductase
MLLISCHSQSGASARLAAAAAAGARAQSPDVQLLAAAHTGAREIAASQGLLLVCAENSGRLAGGAKDLLDRVFYPLVGRGCSLPYALLVSAGNDGRGAVEEARRIFRGIPFVEALEPMIVRGVPDSAALEAARELGEGFATGLDMGIF